MTLGVYVGERGLKHQINSRVIMNFFELCMLSDNLKNIDVEKTNMNRFNKNHTLTLFFLKS